MSDRSFGQIMRGNCEIDPQARAMEFAGQWYDWAFLAETIDGVANILQNYQVPVGAEIAVVCRNRPHQVAAFCAVICSDRCVSPVSPFSSPEKLVADLENLEAAVVIASASDWQSEVLQDYAAVRKILGICLEESRTTSHLVALSYRDPADPVSSVRLNPGVAVLIQSSGTTGKPKRIPIFAAKLSAAYSNIPVGMAADGGAKIKGKPALITQPLVHIGGMFWIVHSLLEARPLSLLDKFNVEQWANAVEQYQIRVCSLVPTMINMVLESDVPAERLESLICVRSGTAPLAVETQQMFEQRFNVPILPTYGATEFSGAVCGWTLDIKKQFGDSKVGSVGRAYEGVDLQVVDPQSGQALAVGETGILQVRSDQMPEESDWVSTTDLASIDTDGFVWLHGRADAAINRGGFKIIPTEVAAILETHSQVKEASVVGIDDSRLGQVPVAAVELAEDASGVSEESLRSWAKDNMTSYFVPVRFAIVDALPRTPSMKVSQVEVKRLFAS
ncbi:MAG: class I adenylate-forming enzyme family protein [Pseudomonadales bacterium]